MGDPGRSPEIVAYITRLWERGTRRATVVKSDSLALEEVGSTFEFLPRSSSILIRWIALIDEKSGSASHILECG
jgi:hypothetical protein